MARIAAGDPRAFRAVAEAHTPVLLAVVRRILGNAADAEEVVQETLLRLWRHAARWDAGKGGIAGWLTRIACNLAVDRVRRTAFWPLDEADDVADPQPSADMRIEEAETGSRVAAAIAGLPARQRAAITLFYDAGLPGAEVARALGVSEAGLWALLHRARRALAASLADMLRRD